VEDRAEGAAGRDFAGRTFAPVLAQANALHANVCVAVFVALHMHAGDGNVHTNLPVNSDDYTMLQEASAAWRGSWRSRGR
jgi:FAD/FMN-containing dehydrogenase